MADQYWGAEPMVVVVVAAARAAADESSGGGDGGTGGEVAAAPVACEPRLLQSFMSSTSHSQSSASVPALAAQSPPLPCVTPGLRTSVLSFVASATPHTAQPEPGSPLKSPTQSTSV